MTDSSSIVVIDDQGLYAGTKYVGAWTHLYTIGQAVNNTLSYTTTIGDTLVFKFNGTGIGVVGALSRIPNGTEPPIMTFTIDNELASTLEAPSNLTSTQYDQTFLLQQGLSREQHTLVINATRTDGSTPILIDYFGYIPLDAPTSTTSLANMQSGIPSASVTASSIAASGSSKSVPVGPIVGGVVGGLALLVFTALALYWLRLRNRRRSAASPNDLLAQEPKFDDTAHLSAQPILPTSQIPVELPGSTPSDYSGTTMTNSPPPHPAYTAPLPVQSEAPVASNSAGSAGRPLSSKLPARPPPPPQPIVHHSDSGVRFGPDGQPIVQPQTARPVVEPVIPDEVPPEYSES